MRTVLSILFALLSSYLCCQNLLVNEFRFRRCVVCLLEGMNFLFRNRLSKNIFLIALWCQYGFNIAAANIFV